MDKLDVFLLVGAVIGLLMLSFILGFSTGQESINQTTSLDQEFCYEQVKDVYIDYKDCQIRLTDCNRRNG